MPIQIEVDEEVFGELQKRAAPLIDTPNSVMRRELGLDAPTEQDGRRGPMRAKAERAPFGTLLPEKEYERPILEVLVEAGGSAPSREVTKAVGERLADRLTELDRQTLTSGEIRWANRVHFTRLRMVEQGLLKRDSPRGTWEISEEGRAALQGA